MEIEIMLSTMNLQNEEEMKKLLKQMNIKTSVVIINQITKKIQKWKYEKENIRLYSYYEKGLSKSRNQAISKAKGDIQIIADDDVKYEDNYKEIIKRAYQKYKNADIIAFFVETKNKKPIIR